ncbi:MAG: protein-L-isoaspartate O-methyltransferase family protein [Hyphomicrobium sp.]
MTDTALQRKNMVESQVRPSDVTDRRITAALGALKREDFVPDAMKPLAYMDEALPLAAGRGMMAARVLARLVQLADIESSDKVLVVGAMSGYSAALIGNFARSVVALESDAALAEAARSALAGAGLQNVTVVTGALEQGHAAGAPYAAIMIDGAVDTLPDGLFDQLAPGGRLVAIETVAGAELGHAIVAVKSAHGITKRVAFDAGAPRLAAFARRAGFVF